MILTFTYSSHFPVIISCLLLPLLYSLLSAVLIIPLFLSTLFSTLIVFAALSFTVQNFPLYFISIYHYIMAVMILHYYSLSHDDSPV